MGELRLSKLLKQESRVVRLDDKQSYKLLGVKWYGQGMFLREEKKGSEIKAEKLYQVKAGDFVYNRLFAWKSSFAIVPKEFDGCLVSNEFPTFTAVDDQVDLEFILRYILLPQNIDQVNRVSGGMSSVSRKRFKEVEFLDFTIPKLSLKQQQTLCQTISRREAMLAELESEKTEQLALLKQLRQAVLQEAVEGKLTTEWRRQHPVVKGDPQHDAAALMVQIKAEKERLVNDGKIRKEKPLPPIADSDKPFDLPEGWGWCRLGDVADGFQYGSSAKSIKDGKFPVLRMGNIQGGRIDWTDLVYTNDKDEANKYSLTEGDLLFNRTNSRELVGKTALFDGRREALFAGYLVRVSMLGKISTIYSNFVLNSKYHREWCDMNKTDALGQSNINATKLRDFLFPLPPLAEQKAIVTRVDSLMAVIDELEKQVAERKEQAQLLMQTVLREAFDGVSN